MRTSFCKSRKRLAKKLQNPRLLQISFHTFRHWKATTLQHQTHDPWIVKEFLCHKSIRSTEIYITYEKKIYESSSDEYIVRAVKDPKEIQKLLEVGFEYVCQKDNLLFLRKRK
jgi:integrase